MSLKAIDGQLAMSRAVESGQIQHQLTQKPTEDQAALAAQFRRQLEEERKKSVRLEQKSSAIIANDEQEGDRQQQGAAGKSARTREESEERVEHPYKGRHIDITL